MFFNSRHEDTEYGNVINSSTIMIRKLQELRAHQTSIKVDLNLLLEL